MALFNARIAMGLVAGTLFLAGCESHNVTQTEWLDSGQPHHTNSHETWWSYQYVYHPYANVYYEPYSRTYFWEVEGQWTSGADLPGTIALDHDTAQVVKLQTEQPWNQHSTVRATTMPPNDMTPSRANGSAPHSYGW